MSVPRDRFITVFGRKPVLEALTDPGLRVDKVLIAERTAGEGLGQILDAAGRAKVRVERVAPNKITALAGNPRQHQGVAADIVVPEMAGIREFLARRTGGRNYRTSVLVLDGVTTPANVGMIIRSAHGAGVHGIVLPDRGTAGLGPLVIKASAGTAFSAPIVRADTTASALRALSDDRFEILGLSGDVPGSEELPESLFDAELPERVALVLGNETDGISAECAKSVDRWLAIPTTERVESLNVAAAATLAAYELARRGLTTL